MFDVPIDTEGPEQASGPDNRSRALEAPVATLNMAGIFDMKWRLQPFAEHGALLAMALADGRVSLVGITQSNQEESTALASESGDGRTIESDSFDPRQSKDETHASGQEAGDTPGEFNQPGGDSRDAKPSKRCDLSEVCAAAVSEDGAMVLSVDWNHGPGSQAACQLISSLSDGSLALLQVSNAVNGFHVNYAAQAVSTESVPRVPAQYLCPQRLDKCCDDLLQSRE